MRQINVTCWRRVSSKVTETSYVINACWFSLNRAFKRLNVREKSELLVCREKQLQFMKRVSFFDCFLSWGKFVSTIILQHTFQLTKSCFLAHTWKERCASHVWRSRFRSSADFNTNTKKRAIFLFVNVVSHDSRLTIVASGIGRNLRHLWQEWYIGD